MTKTSPLGEKTTIDQALFDERLLGAGLQPFATWQTWGVVLKATFGMPLTDAELATFHAVAGERGSPEQRARELWVVAGRKGGKSHMAAAVACYLALFGKYKLAPGERGEVLVVAGSIDQARIVFERIQGFLQSYRRCERKSPTSLVTRSNCTTASLSASMLAASALSVVAPSWRASSTRCLSGVMNRPPPPTSKCIAPSALLCSPPRAC
jgi:hypothetical protein